MKNYVTRRNNDIFEDTFNSFFRPFYVEEEADLMKTDIKETDSAYLMDVEMAGFDKNEITLKFDKGYLTVSAKKTDKQEEGKYIRRERACSCSRSYSKPKQQIKRGFPSPCNSNNAKPLQRSKPSKPACWYVGPPMYPKPLSESLCMQEQCLSKGIQLVLAQGHQASACLCAAHGARRVPRTDAIRRPATSTTGAEVAAEAAGM